MTPTEAERELLANPPESPVPKSHGGKPDERDPWRYVCPECKSQVNQHRESFSYQCGGCRRTWPADALYDKKYGMPVSERREYDP